MTEATTSLNDVDLATIGELVGQYQRDPASGRSHWSARVQWLGGFRADAQVRDLAPVRSDEPRWLGGTESGPNPVELLLGALGQCLAVGYAANASVKGITIRSLEIALEGDVDLPVFLGLTGGNAGYDRIRARVHLESDASRDALEELHSQVISTSPVGNTLANPIPLDIELT